MRPARKGPETGELRVVPDCDRAGFNEAGPQGAGNGLEFRIACFERLLASMRPARKGPETVSTAWGARLRAAGFNEAGPQGAGNGHVKNGTFRTGSASLQ